MVHPRVIVPRTRTSRPFLQRPEREWVWLGPVPRLSKGGAKAEQTGCVRRMATLQPNCGHSGFCFLPIARGKECYPFFPHGKKKNQKLPYLLAHGHRLPNFTGEPRAITGKELRYIITLSAFSVGAGILSSRPQTAGVTVFSLALAPGEITGMAHNTRDGRSSLRMPGWRLCSVLARQICSSISRRIQMGKKVGFSL